MQDTDKPRIISYIEKADPTFVAMHDLAANAVDVLQNLLSQLWEDNWYAKRDTSEQRALFKFVGIHGTLALETSAAAKELALNGLPRAMNILTRSTFEYSVRLRYLHDNADHARRQIDSLPEAIRRELKGAAAFSPQTVERLVESYNNWEERHSDLAKDYNDVSFARMARKVMGELFNTEWWTWYSLPSIIANGKPLAISDTMQIDEEHHIMTLKPNSRHLDVNTELGKVAPLVTELVGFITVRYHVEAHPYIRLNEKLCNVLVQCGFAVKTHHIRPGPLA